MNVSRSILTSERMAADRTAGEASVIEVENELDRRLGRRGRQRRDRIGSEHRSGPSRHGGPDQRRRGLRVTDPPERANGCNGDGGARVHPCRHREQHGSGLAVLQRPESSDRERPGVVRLRVVRASMRAASARLSSRRGSAYDTGHQRTSGCPLASRTAGRQFVVRLQAHERVDAETKRLDRRVERIPVLIRSELRRRWSPSPAAPNEPPTSRGRAPNRR